MSAVRFLAEVDPPTAAAVRALAGAATTADGREPLSEQFLLNLGGRARPRVRHFLAQTGTETGAGTGTGTDGAVVGYAQLDDTSAELVVHPDHRRRGTGAALLNALLDAAARASVWAHGDLPAAAALAATRNLRRTRVLLQMRRTPEAGPLPPPTVPADVTIRPFVVGQDEQEFLRVNNAAFAWHPEQGGWTVDDVRERQGEDWFDPAGFLLAERAGTLVGYHWTKVHPEGVGEVYVLGVDPSAHGGGLGRVLTLAGLHHLADRGLDTVVLYVESDNAPAVRVYEKLGFSVHTVDVQYSA